VSVVARLYSVECRNELKMIWKESAVASARFYHSICVGRLRKITKTCEDSKLRAPTAQESTVLQLYQPALVECLF
jgi:hypothetical protein